MCDEVYKIPIVLACISAAALLLSNIIFSFAYKKYDFDDNLIIQEINDSINGHLITSFRTSQDNCNDDEENLILGNWEGSSKGCLCSNSFKQEECKQEDIDNKCSTVGGSKGKKYKKLNSFNICVKKSKETYKQLLEKGKIVPKGSDCPNNCISCGTIDTLGNIFCEDINNDCPITMKDINKNQSQILFQYPIGYNYIEDKDESIISFFKLSETLPCANPEEISWNSNYTLDYKDSCRTEIKYNIYDNRYEKTIFSTQRNILYKDNNIPIPIDGINEDADKDETTIYLYGRPLFGFKKENINEFQYDDLTSYQKTSNRCNKAMFIVAIVMLGSLGLPILIGIGACFGGVSGGNFNDKACECFCATWAILVGISVGIGFLIHLILCLIIYAYTIKIRDILDYDYSDDFTNEFFQILLDEFKRNYNYSLSGLILSSITVFFGISILITFFVIDKYC